MNGWTFSQNPGKRGKSHHPHYFNFWQSKVLSKFSLNFWHTAVPAVLYSWAELGKVGQALTIKAPNWADLCCPAAAVLQALAVL